MAVTHTGTGVIWGITTTGMSVDGTAITGFANVSQISQGLSFATDTMEHRNSLGEVTGFTTYNQSRTLELECYPNAATIAASRTLRDSLPRPGQRVTLINTADTTDPVGVTTPGTDYICTASNYRRSNSDKAVFTMTLQRFDGISSYAPVTT